MAEFGFALFPEAPCDGWLVQYLDYLLYMGTCDNCKCQNERVYGAARFYEAWEVHEHDTHVHGRSDNPGVTDDSSQRRHAGDPTNDCGHGHARGEIRFFCAEGKTGNLRAKWTEKNSFAGGLPSTRTRPNWWDKPDARGASRSATWSWNCCCKENPTDLITSPRSATTNPTSAGGQ